MSNGTLPPADNRIAKCILGKEEKEQGISSVDEYVEFVRRMARLCIVLEDWLDSMASMRSQKLKSQGATRIRCTRMKIIDEAL